MSLTLQAQKREALGKQNKKLRKQGIVPAVLYGPSFAKADEGRKEQGSVALQVSLADFLKIYKEAGENTLIDLAVEGGKSTKVLIHDVAKHYMKDLPTHVDFYEVDLTKKIHAKIPVHFEGSAPAVKEFGGVLLRSVDEIEVLALPQDLPKQIEVSLDELRELNDIIRISDLVVSEKVEVLSNPEDAVAIVKPPRTMEELEALDEEITDDGVPSEDEEGEEGEEGEEKTEGDDADQTDGDEEAGGEEKKEEEKPEK